MTYRQVTEYHENTLTSVKLEKGGQSVYKVTSGVADINNYIMKVRAFWLNPHSNELHMLYNVTTCLLAVNYQNIGLSKQRWTFT